jgi:hypothetical protein
MPMKIPGYVKIKPILENTQAQILRYESITHGMFNPPDGAGKSKCQLLTPSHHFPLCGQCP